MQIQTPPIQTLAGYRLVRKLGEGARSEVFLGVPQLPDAASGESESRRSVVLKVFRPDTDQEDVGRELAALAAADLPHCLQLIDVASAADGLPVPILERVRRGSIADLLRDRDSIECGEAVTLLAPIASTITALHKRGVAHSRLGAASVHLGVGGEPVLIGFGHAVLFAADQSAAALDVEPAAALDRDRLADLAGIVLANVRAPSDGERVRELRTWLGESRGSRPFEFAGELEDRLFDLADPRPILFAGVARAPTPVPGRLGPTGAGAPALIDEPRVDQPRRSDGRRTRSGAHAATPSRASAVDAVARVISTSPAEVVRARVASLVRDVRKPVWIIVAAVGGALVLALTLLPSGGNPATAVIHRHSTTASSTTASSTTASPRPTARAVSDDPVIALPGLLARREECVRERSVSCLTFVDEGSSQAMGQDDALIRRLQKGAEVPDSGRLTAEAPKLTQRLGDTALVALDPQSGPASALLIREKAGWRIRAFQTGAPIQPRAGG